MNIDDAMLTMQHLLDQHAATVAQMEEKSAEVEVLFSRYMNLLERLKRLQRMHSNSMCVNKRVNRVFSRIDGKAMATDARLDSLYKDIERLGQRSKAYVAEHDRIFKEAMKGIT